MKKVEINCNGARMSPFVWNEAWKEVEKFMPKRHSAACFFLNAIFTAEHPEPNFKGLHMLEFWRLYRKAKPRLLVRCRNIMPDDHMLEFLKNNRTPKIKPMPLKGQ